MFLVIIISSVLEYNSYSVWTTHFWGSLNSTSFFFYNYQHFLAVNELRKTRNKMYVCVRVCPAKEPKWNENQIRERRNLNDKKLGFILVGQTETKRNKPSNEVKSVLDFGFGKVKWKYDGLQAFPGLIMLPCLLILNCQKYFKPLLKAIYEERKASQRQFYEKNFFIRKKEDIEN